MADDGKAADDKGGAGGDGAGGEGKAKPETKTLTVAQIEAQRQEAFGNGTAKVLKKLGTASDEEALELITLGREAKAKAEKGDDKSKGGAGGGAQDVDALVSDAVSKAEKRLGADFGKKLDAVTLERDTWKGRTEEVAIKQTLTFALSAAGVAGANKLKEAVELMRGGVRLGPDGVTLEFLERDGSGELVKRYGDDGKPLTADGAAAIWTKEHEHYLDAKVRGGTGHGNATGDGGGKTMKRAEFDKLDPAAQIKHHRDGVRVVD